MTLAFRYCNVILTCIQFHMFFCSPILSGEELAEVEILTLDSAGVRAPCFVNGLKLKGKSKGSVPKILKPLLLSLAPDQTYVVEFTCRLGGRMYTDSRDLYVRPGAIRGRRVYQIRVGDCSRDLIHEFTSATVTGRITGSVPSDRPIFIAMMHEVSREVSETNLNQFGEFEISLKCEGNYLASLIVDSKVVGAWRVALGALDVRLELDLSKSTALPLVPVSGGRAQYPR